MVGFGYDAMVVRNINYNVKKLNSKLAHVVSGLYTLIINNLKRVYIKINNIDVYAYNLIISLGRKYAGNYNLVKYPFYDGFTICTMESKKRIDIVKSLLSMLLKKGIFADIYLNKSITVYGANFCQLDGEYFALSDNKCEIELIKSDFYIPVYEN
jgi:diacylglycerol kinase family enzyme